MLTGVCLLCWVLLSWRVETVLSERSKVETVLSERSKRSATLCEASISDAFSTPRLQVDQGLTKID